MPRVRCPADGQRDRRLPARNRRRQRRRRRRHRVPDADAVLARYLDEHPELAAEWKANHKLRSDPRVTWIGRWLRSTSLDELPQIWNVLMGEMSLVGPRPIVTAEIEKYADSYEHYVQVLPGITGLAQVCDSRHLTTARSYALDIWAARHRTPALTLRIFLVTPLFMLGWRKVEFANGEVAEIERECLVELEESRLESRLAGRTADGTG